jgi:endonuclease G
MKPIDIVTLGEAIQARNRAIGYYLYDPDVTLIDVGWKIKQGKITDNLAVRVHKRIKPRGEAFEVFAATYPERVVNEQKIGFLVDIIECDYHLQQWFLPASPLRGRVIDPLQGGISISNEWSFGYGTLGGIVVDRDTGKKMILSNQHVLAGSLYAPPGLRIFQPGYGDGGRSQHTIARFSRDSMNVDIDAAVAELIGNRTVLNDQFEHVSVKGFIDPKPDMRVVKSGRGSKITKGIITSIGGVKPMSYRGFTRVVQHVFHIVQVPDSDQVSAPGDSGSWWLEESTNKAVGLHFAGSNMPEYGLAITMSNVLNALNVDIMM